MRNEAHDLKVATYLRRLDDEAEREKIDRIARAMQSLRANNPIAVSVTAQRTSDPIFDPRR